MKEKIRHFGDDYFYLYLDDSLTHVAEWEDYEFYEEEINQILNERNADKICIAWIVPDENCGHIEYYEFETWDDFEVWQNQI